MQCQSSIHDSADVILSGGIADARDLTFAGKLLSGRWECLLPVSVFCAGSLQAVGARLYTTAVLHAFVRSFAAASRWFRMTSWLGYFATLVTIRAKANIRSTFRVLLRLVELHILIDG
jgi:hypothetical protein